MDIIKWLEEHWMQIGFGWLATQTFLKGLQDAIDAEPVDIKDKPLAKISYYMGAIGGYVFTGNRIKQIGGK